MVAVAAYDGSSGPGGISVFDVNSGERVAYLARDASAGRIIALSISAEGETIAALLEVESTKSPNVEIRRTRDLSLISQFSTDDRPKTLVFSGSSEVAVAQSLPNGFAPRRALQLWDTTGKVVARLTDADLDVDVWGTGTLSASDDGSFIMGYLLKTSLCLFCGGGETQRNIVEERYAVWARATGKEVFRTEPLRSSAGTLPKNHNGMAPQGVLSQTGRAAIVYYLHSKDLPAVLSIR